MAEKRGPGRPKKQNTQEYPKGIIKIVLIDKSEYYTRAYTNIGTVAKFQEFTFGNNPKTIVIPWTSILYIEQ